MYPLPTSDDAFAVYLHIPFCSRKCPYCDFYVRTDGKKRMSQFLSSLPSEWRQRLQKEDWSGRKPYSLYFGGGTPSLLPVETVECWINEWRRNGLPANAEITLEANPEDAVNFAAFARAGVNRLSLGIQSFDESDLRTLGRVHDHASAESAVAVAKSAGFHSVSIDLIYGVPESDPLRWQRTLDTAIRLNPDHISCYALHVDPGSAYFARISRGVLALPADECTEQEMELTISTLTAAGYRHYELSNYAHPGHESRHNLAYWTGRPYLACGPSGHGYSGSHRYANHRDIDQWQDEVGKGRSPEAFREQLTPSEHRIETIAMQLRLAEGLFLDSELGIPSEKINEVIRKGWAKLVNGRLSLTPSGLIRENAITAYFL